MAYTQNEKSTGLDVLNTLASNDLNIVGDVSDSGRAKAITLANLASTIVTYIQASLGGLVQTVTGLNTNNADPFNPIIQISVDGTTITGDGTPGNPLVASGGGSGGGGSSAKTKSYSLEGLLGTPVQNGYTNIESYITSNGTTVYAEIDPEFLQVRNTTSDWADADQINSYVVNQGYLFLLLQDTAVNAYRVYRYDIADLSTGGTLMTIAGVAFGTQDFMMMTSDGTDFFFNYQGGNTANDYDISLYTIAGTTLTWSSDTALGAIANAANVFMVDSTTGHYFGLNTAGTREIKEFDGAGALQNTYGPYDSNYTNIINWTGSIYIAKSVGDDEAYRITTSESSSFSFDPSRQSFLFDEFTGGVSGPSTTAAAVYSNVYGELNWYNTTGNQALISRVPGAANHPGIIQILGNGTSVGLTLGNRGFVSPEENYAYLTLQIPNLTVEYMVKMSNAGNAGMCGFGAVPETNIGATSGDGRMMFGVTGGNWKGVFDDGTTVTTTSGSAPVTTGWIKLRMVTDATGANVRFYADGVFLGSLATAPAAVTNFGPIIAISTNAQNMQVDYFMLNQLLSR